MLHVAADVLFQGKVFLYGSVARLGDSSSDLLVLSFKCLRLDELLHGVGEVDECVGGYFVGGVFYRGEGVRSALALQSIGNGG